MKLLKTLNNLITEIASIDDIQNSIRNKMVMVINYDSDGDGGRGYRTIEPVCLGYSKAGNLVLRAWEREGASLSTSLGDNVIPGWRFFRVDKILTYNPTMDTFDEVRPNYNPNGDKTMVSVIINADFSKPSTSIA